MPTNRTTAEQQAEHVDERSAPPPRPSPSPNGHVVLTRDMILAARDVETEWVPVPQWAPPGSPDRDRFGVYVRGLTAGQRGQLEGSTIDKRGNPAPERMAEFRARMLAMCLVDEHGTPLFGPKDVAALTNKSAATAERLAAVARRLSGMSEADEEELLKNSESDPFSGSSTG